MDKRQHLHPSKQKQSNRDQQTANTTNKGHNPHAVKRRQSERGQQTVKRRMRNGTHKLVNRNRERGQKKQQIEWVTLTS